MDRENVANICGIVGICVCLGMFFIAMICIETGNRQLKLEQIKLAQMQYLAGYVSKEM